MREIKFRAKDERGKWHYGYYVDGYMIDDGQAVTVPFIVQTQLEGKVRVVPQTVSEYTGFKDKNGNEIYEGSSDGFYVVKMGLFPIRDFDSGEKIEMAHGWYMDPIDKSVEPFNWEIPLTDYYINRLDDGFDKNIYDNPELLETK
ncbi:YopX family protein [Bacillus cereus]|nr:YopX family protein [Bacillus cereus]